MSAMGIPIALFFILSELNPFDFLMLAILIKTNFAIIIAILFLL